MAKSTPTKIQLRRAIAEDVVHVFKLVKRQSAKADSRAAENNHAAIAYTLDVIERGAVIVADLSGRLVGVVGCEAPTEVDGVPSYAVAFTAVDPAFEAAGTREALLRKLSTFMRKNAFRLRIALGNSAADRQIEDLLGDDFGVVTRIFELDARPVRAEPKNEQKVEEDAEQPAGEDEEAVPEWFTQATKSGIPAAEPEAPPAE